MTNIGIFTYARTGSNWLGHLLNNNDSIYYEEIFCSNYLEYFRKLIPILKLYKIPNNLIDTFMRIYNPKQLSAYLDISNFRQYLDTKYIYSIDLLETLQSETTKFQKNFIYKIFDEHLRNNITLENLNSFTDYSIINYRQNALASYISYHKALYTKEWTLDFNTSRKHTDYSITIDIDKFMLYKNNIIKFLQDAMRTLNNPIVIDYENIHRYKNHAEKKQYVNSILHNGGLSIALSDMEIFQKQNDNLLSHINNYEDIKHIINYNQHIINIKDITYGS